MDTVQLERSGVTHGTCTGLHHNDNFLWVYLIQFDHADPGIMMLIHGFTPLPHPEAVLEGLDH